MSEPLILDGKKAVALLRLVVFEKGADYVYVRPNPDRDTCVNFHDGQPSCIVGHVLANLGVTGEKAEEFGIAGSQGVYDAVRSINASDLPWTINSEACLVLGAAQAVQDAGGTWGEALEAAESEWDSYQGL